MPDARGAAQVLEHCARPLPAAPRRQLSMVPRPLPAAAPVVRRGYLTVAPRPMPAALLVVRRRYLIAVPRSSPRPRRCRSRKRTTLLMRSGKEQIFPVCSVELPGCA
jgi:hypothetical protein